MGAVMQQAPCSGCGGRIERGDLRCAICAWPVPVSARDAGDVEGAKVVRCSVCAAAMNYSVETRAPRCSYCGSVARVETVEDPLEQAEATLPFTVSPSEARQALKDWLGKRGFFRPSDLAQDATVDTLTPLWWPAWVFDAEAEVFWTGDSNAGADRADWAPHAGITQLRFDQLVVSASRGLSDRECYTLAPRFRLDTASSEPSGPEGALTERFDVQRSSARRRVLNAAEAVAREAATERMPGSTKRRVKVSLLIRDLTTRRLSLPTYVFVYRYHHKPFRALVHGQDASEVFGQMPISWLKILGLTAASLAVIAVVLWSFLGR